jgi:formylglycine-generating enzyme required for sulfatase activity
MAGSVPTIPPSCLARTQGADLACGDSADHDCCESPPVTGGSTFLDYNGDKPHNLKNKPVSVSSFRLDKYEVTVGRFRAFLQALPSWRPKAGDGAHPLIKNSGWDPAWPLASSEEDFAVALEAFNQTVQDADQQCHWGAASETSEDFPVGCLTWYELFAFCAWDEGRLPTNAEWFFAAAGGSEQRVFPWSSPPSSTTIEEVFPGISLAGYKGLKPVGSFVNSNSLWQQSDLFGNSTEWVLDNDYDEDPLVYPCTNCAEVGHGYSQHRKVRDLGWYDFYVTADVASVSADHRHPLTGGRCARSP